MCGIAGYIDLSGAPATLANIQRMTDALSHRGPDGEGHWLDKQLAFGHRRLAIIDLTAAGNQPVLSQDGRYALIYNGEVYNFRELKRELLKSGYVFHSETDSEVVLYALIEWGLNALNHFNGMFAFAFWDTHKKSLLIARDRYGIKPLYYSQQLPYFAFASEQKAITTLPSFKKSLDKAALLEYFTFQNLFTERTFIENISILPAGHYGIFDIQSHEPRLAISQYWDFNFREPEHKVDAKSYREELDRLFVQAVQRQLVSDVELGAYLSGGMDSGSITAIAAKTHPYIKTFTCGFDLNSASGLELAFDERSKAEYLSYCFKTEHYEMVLKAGDMERCLTKLVRHLEEPRVGQSYPNFYAAQLASKFVKVVLSGAGGDELFGGYPWRYYRAMQNQNFEDYIDKYYQFWQRLIPGDTMAAVFSPIWSEVGGISTRDIFRDVFQHKAEQLYSPADYINHSLYFEAKTFLHGLLVVEDKLSMAHGLESRVPFLDNDLVDFAMRCPVNLKLSQFSKLSRINENDIQAKASKQTTRSRDGKYILREVMQQYIPRFVTKAAKQGFSAPDASWFKGESIDFVKKKLLDRNALIYNYMNKAQVKALVSEHLHGVANRRLLIWALLSVETLLNQF